MSDKDISVRRKKRYSHVSLGLRINVGNEWKWTKAYDWNEEGLNFYLDHEISESHVVFKRAQDPIKGELVWGLRNDDNALQEMLLNTLLFKQIKKHSDIVKDSIRRIIRLIRTPGMVDEKIRLLSALGLNDLSYKNTEEMIDKHKKEFPAYRYGVRFDSETWNGVVHQSLEASSAALLLDQAQEDLSALFSSINQLK